MHGEPVGPGDAAIPLAALGAWCRASGTSKPAAPLHPPQLPSDRGHIRWWVELSVRPELRQYSLIECGRGERQPFSRDQRALVYQRRQYGRRRRASVRHPCWTPIATGYEFIGHYPTMPAEPADLGAKLPDHHRRTRTGAAPYSSSVFNISAMSFGAISANAIRALNAAREEGRLQPRHRRGQPLALSSPGDGRRTSSGSWAAAISAASRTEVTATSIRTSSSNTPVGSSR